MVIGRKSSLASRTPIIQKLAYTHAPPLLGTFRTIDSLTGKVDFVGTKEDT